MTLRSRLLTVAIVGLVALSLFVGVGVAQETNTTTMTTASDETSDLVAQVDEDVRVESYSYDEDNETFSIVFSSVGDESADVTVTEVISQRDGSSGTFGVEQFSIRPGETVEITIDAELTRGDAAVMIVTQKSLDNGEGTFLQYDSGSAWLTGAATWDLIRLSALGGILGVVILVIILTWHKIADSNDAIEVRA